MSLPTIRPGHPPRSSLFRTFDPGAARRRLLLLVLALAWLTAAAAGAGEVKTLPPMPAIEPGAATGLDVHGFENQGTPNDPDYVFTNPYIPPVSNSLDYRIGLQRKQADISPNPGGTWRVRFYLFAPEKLVDGSGNPIPFLDTADGAQIVADVDETILPSELHDSADTPLMKHFISHLALCDPRVNENPSVCSGSDCYDLDIITGLVRVTYRDDDLDGQPDLDGGGKPIEEKRDLKLWSVPVDIEVSDPKTKDARFQGVTVGPTPVSGALIPGVPGTGSIGFGSFHTPLIVGDNRLLVARVGVNSRFTWHQGATPVTGEWDSVYSYYSGGAECDVTKWEELKPLAYAQDDTDINTQFGFAKYPMRTPSGAAIGSTQEMRARYLWMDQAANNLFFGSLSRPLLDVNGTTDLYDTRCVSGVTCAGTTASEGTAPHQGWMMMGLWTHGKMVLLDSMVNHADFGLRAEEEHHREVALFCADSDYSDCTQIGDTQHWVRVGASRDEARFVDPAAPYSDPNPLGWIDTTVQFHSPENFFNALPQMQPSTPRDVVWQVTTGPRSDEVAFDDYISHRTLIFSPMNALKEMGSGSTYYDGHDAGAPGDMRLQNAATTLKWDVPTYGDVDAFDARSGRIESVALGGVKGRGFFLFENSGIEYSIPDTATNSTLSQNDWLVSLFYDRRKDPVGQIKRLFTFPSGAHILTHGVTRLKICPSSGGCPTNVTLPKSLAAGKWTHLAFHLDDANDEVHVYQDGFLFATVPRPAGMEIKGNDVNGLWVGSPDGGTSPGIEGWIDEFKVVEGPFSPEEICNHARGTLVAVPYTYGSGTGTLQDLWAPFDIPNDPGDISTYREPGREWVHQALHGAGAVVWPLSDLYVCSIDYTSMNGVSLHDVGQGDTNARSIRRRLLFPEGPVVWNEPRPESASNQFCLSCHRTGEEGGLDLTPLQRDNTVLAYQDEHRQPLQAPGTIFGLIPAGYVAPGKPATALPTGPANGANLDEWIDDGPVYRWTFDESGGATAPNWVIGDPDVGTTGATRMNGAYYQKGENRGHALTLDGVNDYARVDNKFDVTGPGMTVAAWFELGTNAATNCEDSLTGSRCTLLAKSGSSEHWLLEVYKVESSTTWRARFKVSTVNQVLRELVADLPGTFDGTGWHHLAGRYDNGDLELFFDGTSIGSKSQSAGDLSADATLYVAIGARLDGAGNPQHPLEGKIDDPRIWNRPLLDTEIDALHTDTP
ncbi:MAG: LamG domain-containing protein [Holophagales bacterium]|nr:LamG domain-containing protein [Holophagales bacterium]